jgi:hypothetical protein
VSLELIIALHHHTKQATAIKMPLVTLLSLFCGEYFMALASG